MNYSWELADVKELALGLTVTVILAAIMCTPGIMLGLYLGR